MSDELTKRAKASLEGVTGEPWRWTTPRYGVPELEGRAGDPEVYAYDQTVLEASHSGECGCRSACELELTITDADREFIAAARQLVPELVDEIERLQAQNDVMQRCIAERPHFITAIKNCPADNYVDYWRWQGHAEVRRQLAQALAELEPADR